MGIESPDGTTVVLTDNALRQIKQLHENDPQNAGKSVRLFVEGSCCHQEFGMVFDHKQPEDLEQHYDGISILLDPESVEFMQGAVVDYLAGDKGGFTISNSRAPDCGRCASFS